MEIPRKLASSIFERKALYYFESHLLDTTEPHYFLMLEIDGQVLHLVVCSSRYEKCKRRIELRGQDYATLVRIKCSADNKLTTESYIDCNNVFSQHTLEKLEDKFMAGNLTHAGFVTDAEYLEVLNGVIKSRDVEKGVIEKIQKVIDQLYELE